MFLYENEICPVCEKPFQEGDDVVTCPDCGTPHHRECYDKLGRCENQNLHGTGFVYKRADTQETKQRESFEAPEINSREEYYIPPEAESTGDKAKPTEISEPPSAESAQDFESREIDGVKLKDISAVISVNTENFIKKFQKKGRLGWNWSALIFGPYYFFFRKMHIQGIVLLAVEYALRLMVSAVYAPAFSAVADLLSNVSTPAQYYEAAQKMTGLEEYAQIVMASGIVFAGMLIIHLFSALTADRFYRRKVINVVRSVDERLKAGGEFAVSPMAAVDGNMSKSQMRRLFLARQGGISTLEPLLAMIAVQLFLSFIQVF